MDGAGEFFSMLSTRFHKYGDVYEFSETLWALGAGYTLPNL